MEMGLMRGAREGEEEDMDSVLLWGWGRGMWMEEKEEDAVSDGDASMEASEEEIASLEDEAEMVFFCGISDAAAVVAFGED